MTALPVICIVDDDRWARGGLEDLIASLGYKTCCFESAEQFIESDAVGSATCLITDLHMPGLSGLANAGALGFLTKPYDAQSLVDCIKLAITR